MSPVHHKHARPDIHAHPAKPVRTGTFSSGSAIMVSLLRLLGVSAKHLSDEVSTTVSQKATTGSATLTSTSAYISLKSCAHTTSFGRILSSSMTPSGGCIRAHAHWACIPAFHLAHNTPCVACRFTTAEWISANGSRPRTWKVSPCESARQVLQFKGPSPPNLLCFCLGSKRYEPEVHPPQEGSRAPAWLSY